MSFGLICLTLILFLSGVFKKGLQKRTFGQYPMRMILAVLAILGIGLNLTAAEKASEKRTRGIGLKALSQEDIQHIEQNSHWITKVHPNKIGAARIHEHLKKNGQEPIEIAIAQFPHEEIITSFGLSEETLAKIQGSVSEHPLPSAVDNSTLPSFPPIGDQQQLGSCVAWGSTYYQATHEYGLLNGINNKTSNAHHLSPKWTYNLLNGGGDNGLNPSDAFNLLSQNGATTLADFPYDDNYLAWDLNPQDWVSAISYRMAPAKMLSGIGGSQPQNLQTIKQLLNNGHVLTFATFVDSWVTTDVKKDPANPDSPAVGEQAVFWMRGSNGGHYVTIVGYNDDVWIDINKDGIVDPGEKGAFLIANSWSESWGNNGFIWISYDAFLATSAVPKGPKTNRVPVAAAMNNYVVSVTPKSANYKPSLIAQFTLSQAVRDVVSIGGGISDPAETIPSQKFKSGALVNQGGSYEFNGTAPGSSEAATFAVDLTDLIPAQNASSTTQRFYLLLGENKPDHPTTLTAFSLIDKAHQVQVDYAKVPVVCDNQNLDLYIDYDYYSGPAQEQTIPVVNITSPADGGTVHGTVDVTAHVESTGEISKVEFFVDSVLNSTETTAPYVASIDTTQLSEGAHEISAAIYDTSKNVALTTIIETVQNTPPTIAINAGGDVVNYKGITWKKDEDFTTPSGVYSTLLNFDNPVYRTDRYGHFSYNVAVDNGPHTVTLKFAELRFRLPGKRIFNVAIDGVQVISHLDLVKVAGYGVPYDLSFQVNVTNNQIHIDFIPVVERAKVNAIEITAN